MKKLMRLVRTAFLTFPLLLLTVPTPGDVKVLEQENEMPCKSDRIDFWRDVLVDETFSDDEVDSIRRAFDIWRESTDGVVSFEVVGRIPHRAFLGLPIFAAGPSLRIYRVNEWEQVFWPSRVLGVCGFNSIALLPDRWHGPKRMHVNVVMHEIGHAIGLSHTEVMSDLMYPTCVDNCENTKIAAGDYAQLCRILRTIEKGDE